MGQLAGRLRENNMSQAIADQQAIAAGQTTFQQLSPDRQTNLQNAMTLAKSVNPVLLEKQIQKLDAIDAEHQQMASSIRSEAESNIGAARAWGVGAMVARVGDAGADFALFYAKKYPAGLGAPLAAGLATEWKAVRGISDKAIGIWESGGKVLDLVKDPRGAVPPGAALAATQISRGAEAGEGESREARSAHSSEPLGKGTERGSIVLQPLKDGLKLTKDASEFVHRLGTTPQELRKAWSIVESDIQLPQGRSATPPGRLERIGARGEMARDSIEAIESAHKGEYFYAAIHSIKAAGERLKANGQREAGERLEAIGDAMESGQKAWQANTAAEAVEHGVQGVGEGVSITYDKNLGSGLKNVGKAIGVGREWSGLSDIERQVNQSMDRAAQSLAYRREQYRLLQRLRMQLQSQTTTGQ